MCPASPCELLPLTFEVTHFSVLDLHLLNRAFPVFSTPFSGVKTELHFSPTVTDTN